MRLSDFTNFRAELALSTDAEVTGLGRSRCNVVTGFANVVTRFANVVLDTRSSLRVAVVLAGWAVDNHQRVFHITS